MSPFRSIWYRAPSPAVLIVQASDLSRFGAEGTVLAGYHYDLGALTIHGRSRFPGAGGVVLSCPGCAWPHYSCSLLLQGFMSGRATATGCL